MATDSFVVTLTMHNGQSHQGQSSFNYSFPGIGLLRQVRFHLLAESAATNPEPLCQNALLTIKYNINNSEPASLTTALTKALLASHRELLKSNASIPLAEQVGIGVTCFALRGSELYIGQIGPGSLYLRNLLGVQKITLNPVNPSEIAYGQPEQQALGIGSEDIAIFLGKYPLDKDHVYLAASSNLENLLTYSDLESVLTSYRGEAITTLESLIPVQQDFAAILVSPKGQG